MASNRARRGCSEVAAHGVRGGVLLEAFGDLVGGEEPRILHTVEKPYRAVVLLQRYPMATFKTHLERADDVVGVEHVGSRAQLGEVELPGRNTRAEE